MNKDTFTFIAGGKAGQGLRKVGGVATSIFTGMGREVFQMDDYPSLIRGGHNFSVVSSSPKKIRSHYMKAQLVVALDKRSYEAHKNNLADNGIMAYNADEMRGNGVGIPISSEAKNYPNPSLISGVASIGILAAAIGMAKKELEKVIKREYPRFEEDNVAYANTIYDIAYDKVGDTFSLEKGSSRKAVFTGNEAIALGAAAGGLDLYFAYPMTPSTSILHFFASHGKDLGLVAMQPENEIAVANMAIGATFTGARSMTGTSAGGFALMQEAFSLAGMVEAPVLFYIGSRSGPSTGVPTYTEQGDLQFALHQGHGEFPRIVASPGSVEEAFYLAAEMLDLVWRFQTPGILLTEKHLAESRMSVDIKTDNISWAEPTMHKKGEYKRYLDTREGISPLLFPPSQELIRWDSYEHDEYGITTENPEMITRMHDKRRKKLNSLIEHMKTMHTVNEYGKGGHIIFTFGSTTLSVLEAVEYGDIGATVIQPIYLKPFPIWEIERFTDKEAIVVEQNSTGQLASLLREKACVDIKAVMKKYDGRPFEPVELAMQLKGVI